MFFVICNAIVSYRGTWIETPSPTTNASWWKSYLTEVRGLKLSSDTEAGRTGIVPYRGTILDISCKKL